MLTITFAVLFVIFFACTGAEAQKNKMLTKELEANRSIIRERLNRIEQVLREKVEQDRVNNYVIDQVLNNLL